MKDKVDPQSDEADLSVEPNTSAAKPTLVPGDDLAMSGALQIKAPTPAQESAALKQVAEQSTLETEAAALRLREAKAKLEQLKAELGTAVDVHSLPSGVKQAVIVTPDPEAPDPLSAAEQALAMAAEARGVPLELPSRLPPDRSDPFAAATRALETARRARGETPPPTHDEPVRTSSRHRDPFKAAEAALERAAAVRAEVGVSPEQEQRETAARAELARLRRVKPTSKDASDSPADDDSPPGRKKRDL